MIGKLRRSSCTQEERKEGLQELPRISLYSLPGNMFAKCLEQRRRVITEPKPDNTQ